MFKPQEGIGEEGELVPGPPWILGHRGASHEAPENTLVSLRRALDLGCDGVEYDLRACATGEAVLIHDETLDRTTDHRGPVSELTLPELAGIDAGGWFHKRFAGEPLALLEEALELPGNRAGTRPMHMIELKERGLVGDVARRLGEFGRDLSVRVAAFDHAICVECRDLGLATMLLANEATEEDRRFVRDEGIAAYGVGPGGWSGPVVTEEWPCERWAWSVDDPGEMLAACRLPLNGFNTNEPRRALAVRALAFLASEDDGPYPLRAPPLEVAAHSGGDSVHGPWSGRWSSKAGVRNPFPFPVIVAVGVHVRGGAFEVEGLPSAAELEPGAETTVPFGIAGGSWSPGDDPCLVARYAWKDGPGRPAGSLMLDAPLPRTRVAVVGREAQRLWMLRERPGQPEASMTVRRRGRELLLSVENAGGLDDLRALVRVGSQSRRGGRGVRILLPEDFDGRREGVAFSCGFEGREPGNETTGRRLRRWAGGIPTGLGSGAPGFLLPRADA